MNRTDAETKFSGYFELPNPGLRSMFARIQQGQPDEYRTPFYKGKSLSQILKGWMPKIESLTDKWPSLVEFENDLAKKVGPLSIQKPLSERLDDIDSYYDSISLESKPIPREAIDAVIREWGSYRGLRLRSERKTVDLMKKSTNSGSPFYAKKRLVVEKTIPCSVWQDSAITKQLLHSSHLWNACAVLGWRGQEGGPDFDDVKQRVVWMFPFAVNIQELRVYQPLIEAAQQGSIVPAWIGMDAVDERITQLFDTKRPDDLIVCTDFSKFDQHFNSDMQNCAHEILSAILTDNSESRDWLNNVFPIKYHIPLAYDWGQIRVGPHGMGSGSGGTNADETLTHRALQYEAAMYANSTLNPNSMCLGDDGILSYPGITVEDVTRVYTSHGQDMNVDKQYASAQDCTYLRRWHHRDYRMNGVCVGVYSTARALGRLAEQERYYSPDRWSKEMVALRQLSILENCKYHPLREEFVDYCMKGDKYGLGVHIPGFLDNITKIAEKAIEELPSFMSYTQALGKDEASAGIASWWIVQYLKGKA